jgi:hypothetical protein
VLSIGVGENQTAGAARRRGFWPYIQWCDGLLYSGGISAIISIKFSAIQWVFINVQAFKYKCLIIITTIIITYKISPLFLIPL